MMNSQRQALSPRGRADASRPPLTLILARTLTQDDRQPEAQGVLVGGGRVLAVGGREDLLAQAPRAEVLDHRDLILSPGLADAHIHLVMYGASLSQLDLTGVRSVAEVRSRLAARTSNTLPASGFRAAAS